MLKNSCLLCLLLSAVAFGDWRTEGKLLLLDLGRTNAPAAPEEPEEPVELSSVAITGDATISENESAQYTLTGTYSDASETNHTADASWNEITTLSNVVLGATGLVEVGDRDTTNNYSFYATYGGLSASNTISIAGIPPEPEEPVAASGAFPDYDTTGFPSVSLALFAAFSPPVSNDLAAAEGAPQVAEWTRQADAGDTIALTGENLTNAFVAFGHGSTNAFESLLLDGQQCALTLPASLPADDMYLLWPTNASGYGSPVAVNRTEAWWLGPDTVSTGETFAVYGRNLDLGSATNFVYCEEYNQWLTNTTANPYRSEFTVPDTWTNGTYTLWAHNGKGREYGWSDSLTLTVISPVDWDDGSTHTVANVSGDDKASILSAISAASGGDTIYFTNGTYEISGTLNVTKDNLRFLGESTNVVITSHSSYSGAELFDISECEGLVFENISIDCGLYMSDITPLVDMNNLSDSSFYNVSFSVEKHPDQAESKNNTIELQYGSGILFSNCVFVLGGSINQIWSEQTFYRDCRFYGVNHCSLFINSGRGIQTSIIGCTLENFNESDPDSDHTYAVGRFYHAKCDTGKSSDVYFGDNSTTNICPRDGYGNQNGEGEHYLVDISTARYRGTCLVSTTNTVTFSTALTLNSLRADRLVASIVGGTGVGQFRDLVSYTTDSITVAKNWAVKPKEDSIIVIGTDPLRHVVYNNYFDGIEWAYTSDANRCLGVNFFGSGSSIVVANNTFHQMRKGIEMTMLFSSTPQGSINRPMQFNLFEDNISDTCRIGLNPMVETYSGANTFRDAAVLAQVYRNNTITNAGYSAIWHRLMPSTSNLDDYPLYLFVYQDNKIDDWQSQLLERTGQTYTLDLKNFIWTGNTTNGVPWSP